MFHLMRVDAQRLTIVCWLLTGLLVAGPAAGQAPRFLKGQLLVATDAIKDPRFHHTVIYMVQHDATGAMGVVVNKPLGETQVALLLARLHRDTRGVSGSIRVHYGGPVQTDVGLALHTSDWMIPDSQIVANGVAITGDPAILEAVARGKAARRVLFVVGYAGWAPDQLEREIDRGDWISVPADEPLIFDDNAATKWDRAMARRRITL
jgi:putative transcriptional regulator